MLSHNLAAPLMMMKVMGGFVFIYVILSLHTRAEGRRAVPGTVSPRALSGPDVRRQSCQQPAQSDESRQD